MDRDLSRPRFCFTQVKWGDCHPLHCTVVLPHPVKNKTLTTTCTVVGAGSHSLGDKIRTPTRPPVLSCPVLSRPSEIRPFSVSKKKTVKILSVLYCKKRGVRTVDDMRRPQTQTQTTEEREGMQQQYVVVRTIGVCLPLQRSQGILPLCVPCCND